MPVERISKGFKDISLSFQVSPLNYDLLTIKNETAISRSVRNLVLYGTGEKFFNETFGSKVSRLLFENIDEISASILKSEIELTIKNNEPRVSLIGIDITPNYDNNEFNVVIKYYIIGIEALPQQLSFALQQSR